MNLRVHDQPPLCRLSSGPLGRDRLRTLRYERQAGTERRVEEAAA